MQQVLLVCTGNTCRSPMAEGLLKLQLDHRLGLEVASAGTRACAGDPAADEAVAAARELGADIGSHRARPVDAAMLQSADVVVAIEAGHADWLNRQYPQYQQKIVTLGELARNDRNAGVADPFGRPLADYRRAARQLQTLLAQAEPALLARLGIEIFQRGDQA